MYVYFHFCSCLNSVVVTIVCVCVCVTQAGLVYVGLDVLGVQLLQLELLL